MTVVLLVGATLVCRSFVALTAFDRGYDPVNLLTATLPMSNGSISTSAFRQSFDDIADRLRALPGVRNAAYAGAAPFMPGGALLGMQLGAGQGGADSEPRSAKANLWVMSPGFVEALGLRVVEGRALAASDTASAEPVAMVNRAFAREYLGDRPLDGFLPLGFLGGRGEPLPGRSQWRIVGVLDDVAPADVSEPTPPQIIVSTLQLSGSFGVTDARFVVRTEGDPRQVVPAFRTIARELAGSAPLDSIMTMEDRISASLSRPRLYTLLLGGFSGFALLVAGVGLFAVLSHGVAARRRELGVRLALGATPRGLLALVLRDGLTLTVAGLVFGVGVAAMASRYLDALLFGVSASDPASYVTGAAVVAAIAVIACAAPALRAARVDPVAVLRL
jgi:predicted permease